jgi:hypothetical protein
MACSAIESSILALFGAAAELARVDPKFAGLAVAPQKVSVRMKRLAAVHASICSALNCPHQYGVRTHGADHRCQRAAIDGVIQFLV